MKLPLRLFFLLISQILDAQNLITTVAGAPHLFPAASPAITASIAPSRIAVSPNGEIYFGDREANVVLKLVSGSLTVVAGNGLAGYSGDGGPATAASLNQPSGFAVDRSGNLYIADVRNSRVRKVDTNGIITTVAGNGRSGFSGDGGPAIAASLGWFGTTLGTSGGHISAQYSGGIAVNANGLLYIADDGNARIRRVDANGVITTVFQLAASREPDQVAVDSAGNLYIGQISNIGVQKVTPGGVSTTISVAGGIVTGLAIDAKDAVYASTLSDRVYKITNGISTLFAGTISIQPTNPGFGNNFFGDGGTAVNAGLATPFGVAADASGNVYIADTFNERIRQVDTRGIITTVAGTGAPGYFGDGGPAAAAGLSLAKLLNSGSNLTFDNNGNLYIADTTDGRIRRVDRNGVITTFADFTGATYIGIRNPTSVATTPDGSVLVAETTGTNIARVGVDKSVRIIAGGGKASPADGVPASNVNFGGINGLTTDAAGNIYLLDGGLALRKIDTAGIVRTFGTNLAGVAIAADKSGNVLLAGTGNTNATTVRRIAPDGSATVIPAPGVSQITGIAGDSSGNIYISDSGNHVQILKISSSGTITPYAGNNSYSFSGDGGLATQAGLFAPTGLAVDAAGNLFIADSYNDRVREVFAAPATYTVSSAALTFSGTSGGAPTASQSISLTPSIGGPSFTVSASDSWFTVTPVSGSMPATLQVTADPSQLAAGAYKGTATITAPNAKPTVSTVSVSFNVQPAAPAKLTVGSQSLNFTAIQRSSAQSGQLQIQNAGAGTLTFTASAATLSGGNWLSISSATGTATPASPATLTVTATPGALTPGTYTGTVTITGADNTVSVNVTLSISAPNAQILVSQSGLNFTAVAQGGIPLPQSFGILNIGQGSMDWSASATTISGGGNWLKISTASGTVVRPYLDVSPVNVSIDPTGLPRGDYYGRIQVSARAGNTPQSITVVLSVLDAGSSLGPEVRPAALIFTGVAGSTPGSQDVTLGNPNSQPNNYFSFSGDQSDRSGGPLNAFTYLPTSASVSSNQPSTLRVFPDFSKLQPGDIDRGAITLAFSDNTLRNVSVLMVAGPSQTANDRFGLEAVSCSSTKLEIQFRSPGSQQSFTATVGNPTTVEVQIVDDCSNLIGLANPQAVVVNATFSNNDADVRLNHIGNGIWSGTWRPVKTMVGQANISVFALASNGSVVQSGLKSISGTIKAGTTPTVTAGGVVHAASEAVGAPIAPGSLITLYGSNLANGTGLASTLPLPQLQNGTRVLLGDTPLPILYTSDGQLNVQVPFNTPTFGQYQISVQRDNLLSVPEQLVIAAAQPGVFTVDQSGTGQGVIFKTNGSTLAKAGTPALAGETVVIYCTGLGAVVPPVSEGTAPPQTPLSPTVNMVTVTIGGVAAPVSFSGLTPGFPGLYQVNAVVPAGVSGDTVPVVVSVAGNTGPAVTMAVR